MKTARKDIYSEMKILPCRRARRHQRMLLTALLSASMLLSLNGCGLIIINNGEEPPAASLTSAPDTAKPDTSAPQTAPRTTETSDSSKVKPVETADNLAKAKSYLAGLTDRSFGGVAINITTYDTALFSPEDAGTLVNAARLERNQLVADKYETKLLTTKATAQKILDDATAAVRSGDYYADLIGVQADWLGYFQAAGLLFNLGGLPFTDYTQPYFDYAGMLETAGGYGVYGALGEFNKSTDYLYCLYFNRSLIKELGLESPYSLVYSGGWTWDKLRELTLAVSDVDGVYGHACGLDIDSYIDVLFASSGEHFVTTGVGRLPELKSPTSRTLGMAAKLNAFLYGDGTVFDGEYKSEGAMNAFYAGKALFYTDRVYAMSWFTDMGDDWGVVPTPKYDESDAGYTTACDGSQPVLAVLKNSATVENTGLFLQAANAASYGYIKDVYYDQLTRDTVRDSDTLNMLDYITGGRAGCSVYFDFSQIYGGQYAYLASATTSAFRSAVKGGADLAAVYQSSAKNVNSRFARDFYMFY